MNTLNNIYSLIERLEKKDGFLLNEITIKDKWQKESNKWNGKLNAETFEYLCSLDPTTNPNKVGRYANWILAKYNPNADFDRLKVCLEWYADGIKRGVINRLGISNDINVYKSYDEFISAMNEVMHSDDSTMSNSEYNNRQKLEGQFEILGSNSTFDIVACKTFEAERYFGSGTGWCTVANEYYFNSYMKQGPLYIIYPKNGDEELKLQFHFESQSYADKYDEVYKNPIECIEETIKDENIQTALIQLCKKVFSKYQTKFMSFDEKIQVIQQLLSNGESPNDVFDDVEYFKNGFVRVKLGKKWNFINQENHLLSDQWYDGVGGFDEGFAAVRLGRKYNFINKQGQILSDQWYDDVMSFHEGFAEVKLNGKCNFINQENHLLSDQWYDWVGNFHEGFTRVELNGKYNFINQENHLLSDQWYDSVWDFNEGFAAVELNGKCNFINQKGQILSDQWYGDVRSFHEGFAIVQLNGKCNFINQKGQILSDQWYDGVWNFYEGFAAVRLGRKRYKLDTNGWLYDLEGNKINNNIKENKIRQGVRLTESSLKRMIKESVRQVLDEESYRKEF